MNKYLALQKDVFDISKVTVVGSPTISDDGKVSNISSIDYVIIPFQQLGQNFEIITPQYNVTSISGAQTLMDITDTDMVSTNFYAQLKSNGTFSFKRPYSSSGSNSISTSYTAQVGNSYRLKITQKVIQEGSYDFNIYVSENNGEWVNIYSNTFTTALYLDNAAEIVFGVLGGALQPFLGTINLKPFKIYADNQLVFQPVKPTYLLERRKEGFDLSKFTVVGSPTITGDGVASGFSETSYIKAIKLLPNDKSWNINIEYVVSQDDVTTTNSKNMIYNTVGDKGIILIWLAWYSNADYLDFIINEEGGTQSTVRVTSNTKFVVNDRLNITIGYDGQKYYQKTYKNSVLLQENYTASTEIVRQSDTGFLTLGARAGNANYCRGSINLPSFSITVDGKEVFTGAVENYYMLRR